MTDNEEPIMTLAEVAEHFGIKPESASRLLRRHKIKARRGYLRSEVEALKPRQGRRTDLEKES